MESTQSTCRRQIWIVTRLSHCMIMGRGCDFSLNLDYTSPEWVKKYQWLTYWIDSRVLVWTWSLISFPAWLLNKGYAFLSLWVLTLNLSFRVFPSFVVLVKVTAWCRFLLEIGSVLDLISNGFSLGDEEFGCLLGGRLGPVMFRMVHWWAWHKLLFQLSFFSKCASNWLWLSVSFCWNQVSDFRFWIIPREAKCWDPQHVIHNILNG